MTEPANELTTKDIVKRSMVMGIAVLALIGMGILSSKKQSISLDTNNRPLPASATQGAAPNAFAGTTRQNPFVPESMARPEYDPAAVDPDALLAALARRNTPTGGMPGVQTVPEYAPSSSDSGDIPAQQAALPVDGIGSFDMRAQVVAQLPANQVITENALRPGDIIRVQLSGSVSSDFPGAPWIGVVTQDVPLSSGRIAIPAGSRIVGAVKVLNGPNQPIMSRMGLATSTIVLPNGMLLSPQGYVTDADGTGAVAGRTRHHVLAQGAGVLGAAALGAAGASATSNEPLSSQSALEAEAVAGAAGQATPFASKYLNVQPTVTLAAGQSVSVVLTAPLEIPADAS